METTQYSKQLHAYLVRRLRNDEDVDDLAQEVHLRLMHVDAAATREPLAYVYRTAHNVLQDFIEKQTRLHTFVEPMPDDFDVVEEGEQPDHALTTLVERTLRKLPPLQATVLILFYCEDCSQQEIALVTGLQLCSIDKYLARGKARLRALLGSRVLDS